MAIERKRRVGSSSPSPSSASPGVILGILGIVGLGAFGLIITAAVFLMREPEEPETTVAAASQAQENMAKSVGLIVPSLVFQTATGSAEIGVSRGSGFVITDDGYLLTNHHVISPYLEMQEMVETVLKEPIEIKGVRGHLKAKLIVFIDRQEYEAVVVDRVFDEELDFALIKVVPDVGLGKIEPLAIHPGAYTSAKIADRMDKVLALGFPAGVDSFEIPNNPEQAEKEMERRLAASTVSESMSSGAMDYTVTTGIVSRIVPPSAGGRNFEIIGHDALISSGSSGGPLMNADHQVIGINTAVAMKDGMGIVGAQANSMRSIYPKIARYVRHYVEAPRDAK